MGKRKLNKRKLGKANPTENGSTKRRKEETSAVSVSESMEKSETKIIQSQAKRGNISVILDFDRKTSPSCIHGPCLLFERQCMDGRQQRFFACAVFRSRKLCQFYQPFDAKVKVVPSSLNKRGITNVDKPTHKLLKKRFQAVYSNPQAYYYCSKCNTFVVKGEWKVHVTSCTVEQPLELSQATLKSATRLIRPLTDNNAHSQYWFSSATTDWLHKTVDHLKFDSVLCVGAPRVFEALHDTKIKRMLLDIDERMATFIGADEYAQYSMLVDSFFTQFGVRNCKTFLENSTKLLIVCDPPFGCMMAAVVDGLKRMKRRFDKLHSASPVTCEVILAAPYYLEDKITAAWTEMKMADYQVTYTNHKALVDGKTTVRFFTTIDSTTVVLPTDSGYRYCKKCKRYVSIDNTHCNKCGICPSKTGERYHHCGLCGKCVKKRYEHCGACSRCHLTDDKRCPLHSS